MPRKVFVAGEILTAADVNTNLMDQAVMVFDDSAARGSAIPSPSEGMVTYLSDTNALESYDGAAFVPAVNTASIGTAAITQSLLATPLNASGSAPLYAVRAWVNFNGTGTVAIRGSGNVSSITDNGTGLYTVNFTTAMSDANYCVVTGGGGVSSDNGTTQIRPNTTPSTTSVLLSTGGFQGVQVPEDIPNAYVAIVR